GAGIYTLGSVALDHSVVGSLAAPNVAADQGGGIWAGGSVTLTASSVEGNRAGTDGGGILVGYGDVSLGAGSAVRANQAPNGRGGGVAGAPGAVRGTGASRVDGNSARNVGGIQVGNVPAPRDNAVTVSGGSTVNDNSSTATINPLTGDFGGGGIAAE